MELAGNIGYLRQSCGMTQEKLAEKMQVSRQTVSKWETGESNPELNKLVELSKLFHCKIDTLLSENLEEADRAYSKVRIERVPGFSLARTVVISPQPEDDLHELLMLWADKSGLRKVEKEPIELGWDFPFVSLEQQNRFGLRGYAGGLVVPEGFVPDCGGCEIYTQGETDYAVVTIREPSVNAFERIPGGYKKIIRYLAENGYPERHFEEYLDCMERLYEKDGTMFMDVYIHAAK